MSHKPAKKTCASQVPYVWSYLVKIRRTSSKKIAERLIWCKVWGSCCSWSDQVLLKTCYAIVEFIRSSAVLTTAAAVFSEMKLFLLWRHGQSCWDWHSVKVINDLFFSCLHIFKQLLLFLKFGEFHSKLLSLSWLKRNPFVGGRLRVVRSFWSRGLLAWYIIATVVFSLSEVTLKFVQLIALLNGAARAAQLGREFGRVQ